MSELDTWWYSEYMSAARRLRILVRLLPCYTAHFIRQPYRRNVPASPPGPMRARLAARHSAAALDTWIDRLLKTYLRLSGRPLRPETGELAVHYIRLLAVFNREYEHRLAVGGSLAMADLLNDELVAGRLAEWKRFTCKYSHDEGVAKFLFGSDVAVDYSKYIGLTTSADFRTNAALQVKSIELDSGGYLVYLIQLIERFNEREPVVTVFDEYFKLGMLAKLVDEMADLASDYAEGRYNLILALIADYPAEQERVLARLGRDLPLPMTWWAKHAPQSFRAFCELFDHFYLQIESKDLRRLGDLTAVRAMGGPRGLPGSRAAEHVKQRPAEPWR